VNGGGVSFAATELPIEQVVDDIRRALDTPGAVVLTAEPGAGKTTVVPLRLLDEPWAAGGRIVMLEPRRVAARATAARMAQLLGEEVGGTVGVITRDDRRVSDRTRIEVVTEGVLTRRLQHDPELKGVAGVIFDEFHERSLQADLGLALTLDVRRSLFPELRVMLMSATIDAARIAVHLDGCPVVECAGRLHPVDIEWAPLGPRDRVESAVVTQCSAAIGRGASGVLAFLPGAGEIGRVITALHERGVSALPLHGGLRSRDQDAALEEGRGPRVIVSTDLAETSLTVPDVDTVVDSGLRRAPRFHPGAGMARLATVPISRASADQRAGRAGRVRAGRAIRLWAESEQLGRPQFDRAEIFDADLADLVLQLAAWGVDDPSRSALLDTPPRAAVETATTLLVELGLVEPSGRITPAGRRVAELGVHPRFGTMLTSGRHPWTAAVLAALLEERDLLGGPLSSRPAALDDRLRLVERDDRRAGAVLRRARTMRRRVGGRGEVIDHGVVGEILGLGFPDRIGRRQGKKGRFVLTGGVRVEVPETDSLAQEEWVVAADIDGERGTGRLLRGVGLEAESALVLLETRANTTTELQYDTGRSSVVSIDRTSVGPVTLRERIQPADPGPETAAVLAEQVGRQGIERLPWSAAARSLRLRSEFVRHHLDEPWPDLSDAALADRIDEWLAPLLWGATSMADVGRADLLQALRTELGHERATRLEQLAPREVTLASGRHREIDYSGERPTVSTRVQDLYGQTAGPTLLGGAMPVTLELLSPASRPIQVTADLVGFWEGSWSEVRKEMAGRYPKHDWPVDPANSQPPRRR
jgi:ATP-dependent helicase HrpB